MDAALDMDGHATDWVNVQAPIRHMFLALTKSIRGQSTDMAVICKRMDDFLTKETLMEQTYPKSKGVELEQTKANESSLQTLEIKLNETNKQVTRMAQIIQHQTTAITDLNFRLEQTTEQLEEQRIQIIHPNYQEIYDTIRTTNENTLSTVQAKLDKKMNEQEVDTEIDSSDIPEAIAHILKELRHEIIDLQSHNSTQKDTFDQYGKDLVEARTQAEVQAGIAESSAKNYVIEVLSAELKPMQVGVSALEKAFITLDGTTRSNLDDLSRRTLEALRTVREEITGGRLVAQGEGKPMDSEKVELLIDRVLSKRRIVGDITSTQVHDVIKDNNQALKEEWAQGSDVMKTGLEASTELALQQWYKVFDAKVERMKSHYIELEEGALHAQTRMEDVAGDVLKSLRRKADQSDLRALIKGQQQSGSGSGGGSEGDDEEEGSVGSGKKSGVLSSQASGNNGNNGNNKGKGNKGKGNGNGTQLSELQAIELRTLGDSVLKVQQQLAQVVSRSREHGTSIVMVEGALKEKLSLKDVEREIATFIGASGGAVKLGLPRRADNLNSNTHTDADNVHAQGQARSGGDGSSSADWKLAVGELGLNLRRELADKVQALTQLDRDMRDKVSLHEFSKVENSLSALHARVVSELTGGLWLWTSRQLVGASMPPRSGSHREREARVEQRIPWDAQVVNAAPSSLLWRKGSSEITVKLPGLYRICVSVFTGLPVSLTVCLDSEPILEMGPDVAENRLSSFANSQTLREERYLLKRLRHSAGDITAVTMDEPVSLPANATLSVLFQSAAAAQAFLSIRKL